MLATLLLSGVTVVLPMEASARGTELLLGEIAEIRGTDSAMIERVRGLDLGNTPGPGYTRLMHAHRIRQDLAREFPGLSVSVIGQPACRVHPEVAELAAADIESAAFAEIARAFAREDATFALREPIRGVSVPAGAAAPTLKVRLDGPVPANGLLSVPVQVLVDGTPYRTIWTSWTAERWETLPVLTRPVRIGQTIQPSHLQDRRVKANRHRGKALPASMLLGAVAARDLLEGVPVTDLDVHRPKVIEVGDDVYLEVRKGAVTARVAATALAPGAIGDRVRVRSTANNQEHTALVVSGDLVRIDLGR